MENTRELKPWEEAVKGFQAMAARYNHAATQAPNFFVVCEMAAAVVGESRVELDSDVWSFDNPFKVQVLIRAEFKHLRQLKQIFGTSHMIYQEFPQTTPNLPPDTTRITKVYRKYPQVRVRFTMPYEEKEHHKCKLERQERTYVTYSLVCPEKS